MADITLSSVGNTISLGKFDTSSIGENAQNSEFASRLKSTIQGMEQFQVDTQYTMEKLLTTGEGDSTQALIAMNEATSQIKMGAVFRDKLLENYQTIMNIQI